MDLVTLHARKQDLLVNTGLNRLGQLYHNLLDDRVEYWGQVADMPVLLHTVCRCCISSWGKVRVGTDGGISTGLLPLHIHQLGLRLHGHQGEGVGTHLIVSYLLSLCAHCLGHLIAFFLLLNHQAILHLFCLTLSLECWDTHLSLLLHIVHCTLLPVILHPWPMGLWWRVRLVVVVVDIGLGQWGMVGSRLGYWLVVETLHR